MVGMDIERASHYPRRDGPLPEGTRWVGRPSRWGNPYRIGDWGDHVVEDWDGTAVCQLVRLDTMDMVLDAFEIHAAARLAVDPTWLDPLRDATALACACQPDQLCHVDVLLSLLADARSAVASPQAA
jgi:hypothetical protein